MFSRLIDWIKAYKIAKKYNLKWDWFVPCESGYYKHGSAVGVNPFRADFYDVFLHEIGHHIHHKKVDLFVFYHDDKATNLQLSSKGYAPRCIFKCLEAEFRASSFAVRCGANKNVLRKAALSYITPIFKVRPTIMSDQPEVYEAYLDKLAKVSRRFYKQ